ncbi:MULTISPECIES: hypothetical protein [Lonsdalea]|uniref:Uncharacterized protein n=2 Tax=Lonsdalea TaxID=1082702 RepID=A0ACD1JB03_9GAMM|nr:MULTISPECIES: hypothetical protein [Lonsdalea]RAT12199.1 hypothetical protein AU485_12350 [Lonsdalea quercina]RAT17298.1 hypothetical protein AU487_16075 [Lonsdalea populi]RAT22569.1 hypothetical protein AU488_11125 [Lonsdalea populi]RAT23668.1 hypothetical protein AU489_10935 [Lonsdalea populi]RAT32516.1 hypothetical protein AU492_12385 [Lonsdalea populi]
MPIIEDILRIQLEKDIFHDENKMVSGIAQLAVAEGFNTLSARQQHVLEPFLTQHCAGVVDLGGIHNGCNRALTDEALLDAYSSSDDALSLQCENCQEERSFYDNRRARIERE